MSVDICIVGAGVAGALVGHRLASEGYSVLLLDSGPRFSYPDMDRYERYLRGGNPWPWEESERDAYEEHADPTILLNEYRIKAVGGTTLHWNGVAHRLQPGDFSMHSQFGVAADWPLSYEDIEPWFLRAEHELGVSGEQAPGAPPRSGPFPLRILETPQPDAENGDDAPARWRLVLHHFRLRDARHVMLHLRNDLITGIFSSPLGWSLVGNSSTWPGVPGDLQTATTPPRAP